MSLRVKRFSSTLKHCLGDILLNDVNNPGLKFISITRVDVSPDLKKANVFFSSPVMATEDPQEELTHAKGFLKVMVAKKMALKHVPDITFIKDTAF